MYNPSNNITRQRKLFNRIQNIPEDLKSITLLSLPEVCMLLGVSRNVVAGLPIPRVLIGKRYKFRLSDIETFLRENKDKNLYEIERKEREKIRKFVQEIRRQHGIE